MATIIWTRDGCWYQANDKAGEARTSYLGHIGSTAQVRSWCADQAIEFREWHEPLKLPRARKSGHHVTLL